MVPPLIVGAAVVAGGAWVGNAIFGGTDNAKAVEALQLGKLLDAGDPASLRQAAQVTDAHARKQDELAKDADKLVGMLTDAWQGDASDGAREKIRSFATAARETAEALGKNATNFDTQMTSFSNLVNGWKPLLDPPPESGFLDRLAPWDTDTEDAVKENQANAEHNLRLYEAYAKETQSNAEQIEDEYGKSDQFNGGFNEDSRRGGSDRDGAEGAGGAGGGREDARRAAEAAAQREMEEARRKAAEEARRRQMEADALRRQQEADALRRQQEAEALRRQQEAEALRRQREAEALRRQQTEYQRPNYDYEGTRAAGYTPPTYGGSGFGPNGSGGAGGFGPTGSGGSTAPVGFGPSGSAAAGTGGAPGKSTGAMQPGGPAGAGGGARGGAGMGGGKGGMPMGGMMGAGAGRGQGGEDKEHKRKLRYEVNPEEYFGTDEKSVPPVIGDK